MNAIQQECDERVITRLCHFTQSRNIAHIFSDHYEVYSTSTLKEYDMPHNISDPDRYDGKDDMICCSIEYPNAFYFSKARERERLFQDWVVLLIEPSYLWQPNTLFCPCNAATAKGEYIKAGIKGFKSLYERQSQSSTGEITRSQSHLPAAPTDIQAEVLLEEPINLESISGIVVKSEEQAKRELFRLKLQGITMDKQITIAPHFFDSAKLRKHIRGGGEAIETLYEDGF